MHVGFYDKQYWKVEHVLSPALFYLALPCILEEDAVIFFSSFSERDDSTAFLERHLAPENMIERVEPSTSSEARLWTGHYLYTQALRQDFECYFQEWNTPIADDIACYRQGELLLWFHDALSGGDLHLAGSFTKDAVSKFCAAMAPTFEPA